MNPVITRNGIDKTFTEQTFGKKSPHKGAKFLSPVITPESYETDKVWVGDADLFSILNKVFRTMFADIWTDNIREDGSFDEEKWRLDAAEFTAGVDKLSEIDEQLEEFQALQQTYALDENFGATNDDGTKTKEAIDLEEKLKELALKVKPLRIKKKSIEETYAERAAKRKARKEAEAAVAASASKATEAVAA